MTEENGSNQKTHIALSTYIKLIRAAESVSTRAHHHLTVEKMSYGQFAVLEALYHLGPLCQRDLATKILKTPRNITMIVDNLEKRDLVERKRSVDDRRYQNVHITGSGKAVFERILPRHIKHLEKEMQILTSPEMQELGRLCRILGTQKRGE